MRMEPNEINDVLARLPPSSNSAVITDSIIKNKEITKRYWERQMSADFQNTMVAKNITNGTMGSNKESLIEKEIRMQKEREEALENERRNALKLASVTKSDVVTKIQYKSNNNLDIDFKDAHTSTPVPAARKTFTKNVKLQNGLLKSSTLNKRFSSMSNLQFNGHDSIVSNGFQPTPSKFNTGTKQQIGFKTQKGLMQKFLETHSKKTTTPPNTPVTPVPLLVPTRPVKIDLSDIEPSKSQNHPNWTKRPGYVSTEDKIQKELEEMRLRENELKSERAKLFGLSQPNLLSIGLDKESDTDSGIESMGGQLRSVLSNPNLLDEKDDDCDDCISFKPLIKKKSAIFEVWERRARNQE